MTGTAGQGIKSARTNSSDKQIIFAGPLVVVPPGMEGTAGWSGCDSHFR